MGREGKFVGLITDCSQRENGAIKNITVQYIICSCVSYIGELKYIIGDARINFNYVIKANK